METPPMAAPSVPLGWVAQWERRYQRWFYVSQDSGRAQWEHPSPPFTPGPPPATRSYPGVYGGQPYAAMSAPLHTTPYPYRGNGYVAEHPRPGYGGGYPAQPYGGHGYGGGYPAQHYGAQAGEKTKSGSSGVLMGAAGGLAVGAIGGALVANALNDSDNSGDEEAPAPAPPAYYPPPEENYYAPPSEDEAPAFDSGPPPVLGAVDEDGNSISSGDRERVAEAREEYEEALVAAADSDAASSDHEAVEEAREAYEEAYQDVYGGEEEDYGGEDEDYYDDE
ncbi:hypothetical protein SODALDRAFT_325481 [Sodiomyces alkalinus F11]|uniref:WW domain-containing protein n=1 Tax=Sodiomyces alkalinus (strain CBS 110278 / VKM F-3762 / F11) TaxID=1314773 RepID=A0A3N2PQX2_SODAK|nr:hypothetical protein SODALDRAFT_325481 [Sodiomyces alkalinus F11]ROT36913.1 hypothetical protein SODALDRAFT_325481 [Sodiomyces alkalinus F11]